MRAEARWKQKPRLRPGPTSLPSRSAALDPPSFPSACLPAGRPSRRKVYSALLVLICFAPAAPVRVSLMLGSIATFLYTRHFKPRTWIKNLSVAAIW